MTNKQRDEARKEMAALIKQFLIERNEDVDYMASNILNLPATTPDGEEFEFEIKISIPETTEDNDCYAKRETYRLVCKARKEREEKRQKEKEAKIKKVKKR